MNLRIRVKKRLVVSVILLFFFLQLFFKAVRDIRDGDRSLGEGLYEQMLIQCVRLYNPFRLYMDSDWEKRDANEWAWYILWKNVPIEQYARENDLELATVREYMQEQETVQKPIQPEEAPADAEPEETTVTPDLLQEAVISENQAALKAAGEERSFVPASAPAAVYSREQLREAGFIKKTFYSEDPTTQLREEQVQYDTLMGFDATLKQDSSAPQILIYHTHSQEAYIDSTEDISTTILGVGEHLCEILRTRYGYNVIHHMGQYDVESRDYAYSNAMAGLEQVLRENPSIEVVIDLHRDETRGDTHLVTTIQDIPMARFMFFNGLSYTKERGELTTLPNPYVQDNLSFAFQMQLAAEEYYPGLTRRIYLKGYRYNLHYRPKSLLIELGSQTNTVEEAMNSCEPIAHIISMVLNGENKSEEMPQ
ncbi:MAG: stage II sporulation protein P [Roseburia sp.]|nr:stage II sporulation protein P [Roseburia sp.]